MAGSFTISPTQGAPNTTPTITASGVGTAWAQGVTGFFVAGGSGASIGTVTIGSTTSATFPLTTGTIAGPLTITNNQNPSTPVFTVTGPSPLQIGPRVFAPPGWMEPQEDW